MVDFKETNELHERLLSLRPLKELDIKRLRDDERIEMVYASNALEGNTLTISETQMILEKGLTVDGKSMRDHLEVVNLNDAIIISMPWRKPMSWAMMKILSVW